MKKLGIILFVCMGTVFTAAAQVDSTIQKVGDKSAELASKGKSSIVDQVYKDKEGPKGQTIYIDHSSKYYYVDKKGKKVYVSKKELKDKPAA